MKKFQVKGRETVIYEAKIVEAETREDARMKYFESITLEDAVDSRDFEVDVEEINSLDNRPPSACSICGGWTKRGEMSHCCNATDLVMGRTGCTCKGGRLDATSN